MSFHCTKNIFFSKIMQAFKKNKKKTSYTLLMKNGKILQVWKVSNRSEYSALLETIGLAIFFRFSPKASLFWKWLQYFPVIHQKRVRRLFIFFLKKLALFLKKRCFWCIGKTFRKKKHLGNFPGFCPIWNFSDLQYLSFIHQKRVRRLLIFFEKASIIFEKKTLLVQWKDVYLKKHLKIFQDSVLFGLAIFSLYSSKACKTSFYFFSKACGKTSLKKTLFQYSALFETFRTWGRRIE